MSSYTHQKFHFEGGLWGLTGSVPLTPLEPPLTTVISNSKNKNRDHKQILVLVEPSLLVRDCLFVGEISAYFAANLIYL